MRYVVPLLLLATGCTSKEPVVPTAPVKSGPLEPGEMAVVIREDFYDSGYAVVFDGPALGEQDSLELPIGSKVLVIAPEDDCLPAPDEWLTVLAGPGVAHDFGKPVNRQVRGVVRAATLTRPLPAPPPGTPPTTAP